jgi:DNA modification methylase
MFPVRLPAFMMNTWTQPNDICYDPFMGSGTSIIAGQDLNRNVRGIDIAPAYIDVCIRRFHAHSPDAEITLHRDGQTFTYQEMFE